MDTITGGNLLPYIKDGILAALVIYLLVTDRQDRKADREFWAGFVKENSKKDKTDA